jgi:hypothetical protein
LKRRNVETPKAARAAVEIAHVIIDEWDAFAADQVRRTAVAATLKPLIQRVDRPGVGLSVSPPPFPLGG